MFMQLYGQENQYEYLLWWNIGYSVVNFWLFGVVIVDSPCFPIWENGQFSNELSKNKFVHILSELFKVSHSKERVIPLLIFYSFMLMRIFFSQQESNLANKVEVTF